jgi:DNA invertase Pin-like site-specific DNA recombinase
VYLDPLCHPGSRGNVGTKQQEVKLKPAAIYARVSTSDQDHEMQLHELRALAQARGWEATEYIDTGSGASTTLPERKRLLEDAKRGKVHAVLVWRFDRFARSTRQLVDACENFQAWGVQFISSHEGIDTTTPGGRFAFTVFAAIAEFERELIRERTLAGMHKAKLNGTRSGRPVGRPTRPVDVRRAQRLHKEGKSWREVSRIMGIPRTTLRNAIQEEGETGVRDGD